MSNWSFRAGNTASRLRGSTNEKDEECFQAVKTETYFCRAFQMAQAAESSHAERFAGANPEAQRGRDHDSAGVKRSVGVRVQFGSSLSFARPARQRAGRCVSSRVLPVLTRRQLDLAPLLASGLRNKAIASQMGISEGRVKVLATEAYARVGAGSRLEFAEWFRYSGLDGRRVPADDSNVVRTGAFE